MICWYTLLARLLWAMKQGSIQLVLEIFEDHGTFPDMVINCSVLVMFDGPAPNRCLKVDQFTPILPLVLVAIEAAVPLKRVLGTGWYWVF